MIRLRALLAAALAPLALVSCDGVITSTGRAVFVLFDASGSYREEAPGVMQASKRVVAKLQPGDWLGAAQISSCSFADVEVLPGARLPTRPSAAIATKEAVFAALDAYNQEERNTAYTDIHGALAGAAVSMSRQTTRRFIIVFSDLVEDLDPACNTSNTALDLSGFTVIASNVIRLKSDGPNPELYEQRIASWRDIVTAAGGEFVHATSIDDLLTTVAQ